MADKPENNKPKKTKGFLGMFKKDVDAVNKQGYSLLQMAVKKGNDKKVRELLKLGASPDFAGTRSADERPLSLAIQGCHIKIAKDLLKYGACPDQQVAGCSYVSLAVKQRYPSLVDLLLGHKANKDLRDLWTQETPLFHIRNHDAYMVPTLVRHGYDVNARNHKGHTALYHAVINRNFTTATKLLKFRADPNITPDNAPSLMQLVLENARSARDPLWYMVGPLLENGADANETTSAKENLFMLSIRYGDPEIMALAIKKSGNIKSLDAKGNTALHHALKHKNLDIIAQVLAVYDRMPTTKNAAGDCIIGQIMADNEFYLKSPTPQTLEVIKSVLDKGANPDAQDPTGRTLLHWAVEHQNQKLVDLILQYKPDLEILDEVGYTPLCHAVLADNLDLADSLLDAGADPNIENQKGWTILDLLSLKRDDRTSPLVQRLMAAGGVYIKQIPANDHAAKPALSSAPKKPPLQKGKTTKPPPRF